MKRLKKISKWILGTFLILVIALIVLYFYMVHQRADLYVTKDLIGSAEKLALESDKLPALFYELYDLNFPNGTTNSPNQQVLKVLLGNEKEGCTCRYLARLYFASGANNSHDNWLGHGLNNIAVGNYLFKKYGGKVCLDMYVNRFDYVNGQIGVRNAANFYFNKSLNELGLFEIGTLIVMTKNPSFYNPIRRPDIVKEETNKLMKKYKKD